MKLIILASLLVSSLSFAADDLKCKSSKGSKLEYSSRYGELTITSRRGNELVSIDGLANGDRKATNNLVTMDIIYGDEEDYQVAAQVQIRESGVTVSHNGVSYLCY